MTGDRLGFDVLAVDGAARRGRLTTRRGSVETPCFMPVGTRAAVRTLTPADLEGLGAQIVLGNTYHLMLRPGIDVIEGLGGLHRFMDWSGHLLTDSGGYQIFSLEPRVDDDGAVFRSTYDGSTHRLTPERAVEIQTALGSDVQMVLDVCPPIPSPPEVTRLAVDRTAAWAARARRAFLEDGSATDRGLCQFGIVQGGLDLDLRRESAARTVEVGFEGYAVGGLSVGEDRAEWLDPLGATAAALPADRPRYFMGLGDPVGLVEAVARGVDLFDCVLPTRLARHGTVLTSTGRLNLRGASYALDDDPIDPGFPASPAARWSRGYLRHLLQVGEPAAARMLTLHNVAWLLDLIARVRAAIEAARFGELRREVNDVWAGP